MRKTLREHSRITYTTTGEATTVEQINTGSLQRIADACELMAKDREKLERDYKYMRASRDRYLENCETLERRVAALKGVLTKMKKAAQEQG